MYQLEVQRNIYKESRMQLQTIKIESETLKQLIEDVKSKVNQNKQNMKNIDNNTVQKKREIQYQQTNSQSKKHDKQPKGKNMVQQNKYHTLVPQSQPGVDYVPEFNSKISQPYCGTTNSNYGMPQCSIPEDEVSHSRSSVRIIVPPSAFNDELYTTMKNTSESQINFNYINDTDCSYNVQRQNVPGNEFYDHIRPPTENYPRNSQGSSQFPNRQFQSDSFNNSNNNCSNQYGVPQINAPYAGNNCDFNSNQYFTNLQHLQTGQMINNQQYLPPETNQSRTALRSNDHMMQGYQKPNYTQQNYNNQYQNCVEMNQVQNMNQNITQLSPHMIRVPPSEQFSQRPQLAENRPVKEDIYYKYNPNVTNYSQNVTHNELPHNYGPNQCGVEKNNCMQFTEQKNYNSFANPVLKTPQDRNDDSSFKTSVSMPPEQNIEPAYDVEDDLKIALTGDPSIDEEILAFYKARNAVTQQISANANG